MAIYLGLGTNQGDRERNLHSAICKLNQNENIQLSKISSIFESEPIGYKNQPWFLNAVINVDSNLKPYDLLQLIKSLEKQIGRKKSFRWGPRIIDLDILSYGNYITTTKKLTIPHLEMHLRKFVLVPLVEIAPNYIHPASKLSIQQMLKQCPDSQVFWYAKFNI